MAEQISINEDINDLYDNLTGTQKCAILMMLLGEDEAAEIMKNLSPKEVQTLGSAMYSVQGLPQETVNLVLDEFFGDRSHISYRVQVYLLQSKLILNVEHYRYKFYP